MSVKRKIFIFSIAAAFIMSGCGIAGFESLSAPNAPAGLTVSSSNRYIYIQFGAYNNEDFFAGYNVFISDQHWNDVILQKTAVTNDMTSKQLPTFKTNPSPEYRYITIVVKYSTNDLGFSPGTSWYVGVAAYDFNSQLNSSTSEVHKVTIND